jgi:hypothetical protein
MSRQRIWLMISLGENYYKIENVVDDFCFWPKLN